MENIWNNAGCLFMQALKIRQCCYKFGVFVCNSAFQGTSRGVPKGPGFVHRGRALGPRGRGWVDCVNGSTSVPSSETALHRWDIAERY